MKENKKNTKIMKLGKKKYIKPEVKSSKVYERLALACSQADMGSCFPNVSSPT